MAGNSANAHAWEGADVYVADVGTVGPTDLTTAWAAGWSAVGLLSEDGLTVGREEDIEDHYAWGNILVKTTRSHHKRTFAFTMLEDNAVTFGIINPGSTSTTDAGPPSLDTRVVKAPTSNTKAFGFELREGTSVKRMIVPTGEVFETAEIAHSESQLTGYSATVSVYPDGDTGELYTEIVETPAA